MTELKGYLPIMAEATGRTDVAELQAIEGMVMDLEGPTLNHLPRATLIKSAKLAEALLFGGVAS